MKKRATSEYIADCTQLLRDLNDVYADHEFILAGGKVHYAVDFSEVHAYVLPEQSASAMRAFRDDDLQVARAVQVHALNGLFNDARQRPILLSPYVIELEAFVRGLGRRDMTALGNMAVQALNDYERLRANPELAWVEALGERVANGELMSPDDAERAQRFVEEHAVPLVTFFTEAPDAPRKRLSTLLTGDVFQELAELLGRVLDPDLEFAQRMLLVLDRSRPRPAGELKQSSNHLDALALALVREANVNLEPNRERVRLVTRSSHMRLACDEFGADWAQLGGNPVRHPRFFSSFHALLGNRGEDALAQLNVMRQSLEAFLAASGHKEARGTLVAIEDEVSTLKALWRTSLGLSATLMSDSRVTTAERARQMLALFSETGGLRKRLERRVVEMADEMQRDYQALGLLVRAQASPRDRELVEAHSKQWGRGQSAQFGSSLHYMPYMIEFHTAEVKNALEHPETSWQQLSRLGPGRDFERLLAMAYLFGTWGQWELAERYCDLALSERDFPALFDGEANSSPPAMHEGFYFKGVCIKEQAETPERMRDAFELLERAEATRKMTGAASEDPRYVQEKAAVVFLWNELLRKAPHLAPDTSGPPPDRDAAAWSAQVLKLLAGSNSERSRLLRARVHNNLCYYFGERGNAEASKLARRHLQELEALSAKLYGKWESWPPNVLDTVAWVRWRLEGGDMSDSEQENVEAQFETALRHPNLRPAEKRQILDHLKHARGRPYA